MVSAHAELSNDLVTDASLSRLIIQRQLNRSGNILLSALEPMSAQDLYAPALNGVSPAWTLGHLACVTDLFAGWLDGRGRLLSPEIHQVFNALDLGDDAPKTKAHGVDPDRYTKGALILMFREAQVRLLAVLRDFDMRRWDLATGANIPDTLPTYGAIWEALAVHTTWHLGELAGAMPRFHGTYTLNSVLHYFFVPPAPPRED